MTSRTLRVLATIVACCLFLAIGAQAHAERDPFDPLVDEEAGSGSAISGPASPATRAPAGRPAGGPSLPSTGAQIINYLVLSFMLMATGAALLLLERYRQMA